MWCRISVICTVGMIFSYLVSWLSSLTIFEGVIWIVYTQAVLRLHRCRGRRLYVFWTLNCTSQSLITMNNCLLSTMITGMVQSTSHLPCSIFELIRQVRTSIPHYLKLEIQVLLVQESQNQLYSSPVEHVTMHPCATANLAASNQQTEISARSRE